MKIPQPLDYRHRKIPFDPDKHVRIEDKGSHKLACFKIPGYHRSRVILTPNPEPVLLLIKDGIATRRER